MLIRRTENNERLIACVPEYKTRESSQHYRRVQSIYIIVVLTTLLRYLKKKKRAHRAITDNKRAAVYLLENNIAYTTPAAHIRYV